MLLDFSIYTPTYVSFLWAIILLITSRANRARFFLGIFMFMVSVIFLSHVVYYHHLKEIYPYFDLLFVFGSLSIFPIYFWYIKLLTFRSKIDFRDLRLLLPAFVMLIATIVTYLLMPKEVREVYVNNYLYGNGGIQGASTLIKIQLVLCYLLQVIYFLQIVISFLKVRVYIAKYNENIANYYSNLDTITLQWPKIILYSFIVSSVFTIITNFLGRSFFDRWPLVLLFTCISYSLFLFVLGYLGYLQNNTIVTLEQIDFNMSEIAVENLNNTKIKAQLIKLFEKEQIFTQADLKITDIASKLNTNRTYISTFINHEYACSFSTFVNRYRVEEAKKALLNVENDNFSLEHIASEVGFGTLHSFIRVFKEFAGCTPGRFRDTTPKSPAE